MTEISLIVTLNTQFTSPHHLLLWLCCFFTQSTVITISCFHHQLPWQFSVLTQSSVVIISLPSSLAMNVLFLHSAARHDHPQSWLLYILAQLSLMAICCRHPLSWLSFALTPLNAMSISCCLQTLLSPSAAVTILCLDKLVFDKHFMMRPFIPWLYVCDLTQSTVMTNPC